VLGIDLGLKTAATASNGDRLTAKHYHRLEEQLAGAQRARKKDRVRAISAKIRNQRKDALHNFTTALVNDYGAIFIGN
jgi:transposase